MRAGHGIGIALVGAIALYGAFFSSCSRQAHASEPGLSRAGQSGQGRQGASGGGRALTVVQATVAATGELVANRTTAGIVSPAVQSNVAAPVAGIVLATRKSAGDWVGAGDIVVQLDDSQSKLSLANAQAALESANINLSVGKDNSDQAVPKLEFQVKSAQAALDGAQKFLDSQKALFDLGGLSASTLDAAKSQLATAQANLEGAKTALEQNKKSDGQSIAQIRLAAIQAQNQVEQAKLNLQNTGIRAPFAGQIAAMNVQPGMYVSLNTPAFILVSGEKQIAFNVSPGDAPSLRAGSPVSFDYGGSTYPARVRQAPSAPINGVVPLAATIPGSVPMPFGAVGNVSYRVPLAKGILVPLAALAALENRNYVFTIEAGRVSTKDVKVAAESGAIAAVEGLAEGEIVVVSPPPGLIQGSQVQATMLPSTSAP